MSCIISKELLSEVLETKAFDIEISNSTVVCLIGNGSEYRININELAHKCKEWAASKGYYIYSGVSFDNSGHSYITLSTSISKRLITFSEDTEPESIFKACQWVMEKQ